jgi:hypothetical protein
MPTHPLASLFSQVSDAIYGIQGIHPFLHKIQPYKTPIKEPYELPYKHTIPQLLYMQNLQASNETTQFGDQQLFCVEVLSASQSSNLPKPTHK